MAIKKIANGKWRVQVDVGTTWKGKRDRRTKTVRSRREAEQQEREWFAERDRLRGSKSTWTSSGGRPRRTPYSRRAWTATSRI